MHYDHPAIPIDQVPPASDPLFGHLVDTYVSEANKTVSMWRAIPPERLEYRPHEKVNDLRTILTHQLLSERRFFAQFIGTRELPVESLLPAGAMPDQQKVAPESTGGQHSALSAPSVQDYIDKYLEQVLHRLPQIAAGTREWWLKEVPFFGLPRQRIWTFWRRVLHTAHHRTQVQLFLRLAGEHVPTIYGPSGDVHWDGADPTYSVDAAGRP